MLPDLNKRGHGDQRSARILPGSLRTRVFGAMILVAVLSASVVAFESYRYGRDLVNELTPLNSTPEARDAFLQEWLDGVVARIVATLVLIGFGVLFLSAYMSALIGRPLKNLAHLAHRIRDGNKYDFMEATDSAEAEEVRHAINLMLQELQVQQDELVRTSTLSAVGELSTRIVHEMRNPLSSIKMNIQALQRQNADGSEDRELVDIAATQVSRVENMLTELLQFGKPIELRVEPISFMDLLKDAQDAAGTLAQEKNVEIEMTDMLGEEPVFGDREQLCRALSNLLVNAIAASPVGGKVEVLGRRVDGADGAVSIEVSDRGEGIAQDSLELIFEPFYSTKASGTGLGLANVRKIAQMHGGTISAEQRVETGARFVLRLPGAPLRNALKTNEGNNTAFLGNTGVQIFRRDNCSK